MKRSRNTQMFALSNPPPDRVQVAGAEYRIVRVFKHDFFAATCLYAENRGQAPFSQRQQRENGASPHFPLIVVKYGRDQQFCGLPMEWYGRMLRRHEEAIYQQLTGIAGVPKWVGVVGATGFAIEYVDAVPLDHVPTPPPGFFDRLREVFDAIHARGVAYCDANKRSNILVTTEGNPALIDYQISFRRRDDLPWPLRAIIAAAVRYVQRSDLYHLYKHKRRLAKAELRAEEEELSRRRGLLHTIHRHATDPYRTVRRWLLRRKVEKGQLVSPTEHLEDHYQPEKARWRE